MPNILPVTKYRFLPDINPKWINDNNDDSKSTMTRWIWNKIRIIFLFSISNYDCKHTDVIKPYNKKYYLWVLDYERSQYLPANRFKKDCLALSNTLYNVPLYIHKSNSQNSLLIHTKRYNPFSYWWLYIKHEYQSNLHKYKKIKFKIIIKMNFKIILFAILFSGFNCSPVTRDTQMENESKPGRHIHRRSTADHGCIRHVEALCNYEKKNFHSRHRLDHFERCVNALFIKFCG